LVIVVPDRQKPIFCSCEGRAAGIGGDPLQRKQAFLPVPALNRFFLLSAIRHLHIAGIVSRTNHEHIEADTMRRTGKLDYLEMPATAATFDAVKSFYSSAFGWSFKDYGPAYAAFDEGLEGGFHAEGPPSGGRPLPVLYSTQLEKTLQAVQAAGGKIVRPIFEFPGGRRFHFEDPAGNELAVWSE
jgi:predicted enzyme related to lactoylglutathione lyase